MVLGFSEWVDNSHVIILVQVHLISFFLKRLLWKHNGQFSAWPASFHQPFLSLSSCVYSWQSDWKTPVVNYLFRVLLLRGLWDSEQTAQEVFYDYHSLVDPNVWCFSFCCLEGKSAQARARGFPGERPSAPLWVVPARCYEITWHQNLASDSFLLPTRASPIKTGGLWLALSQSSLLLRPSHVCISCCCELDLCKF